MIKKFFFLELFRMLLNFFRDYFLRKIELKAKNEFDEMSDRIDLKKK